MLKIVTEKDLFIFQSREFMGINLNRTAFSVNHRLVIKNS